MQLSVQLCLSVLCKGQLQLLNTSDFFYISSRFVYGNLGELFNNEARISSFFVVVLLASFFVVYMYVQLVTTEV